MQKYYNYLYCKFHAKDSFQHENVNSVCQGFQPSAEEKNVKKKGFYA